MAIRAMGLILLLSAIAMDVGADREGESPNFMAALTDVAAGRVCEHLEGRFRNLKSEGRDHQDAAVTGTLWIKECRAGSVEGNPHILALSIKAQGWRWIYQKKEKLAAEFEISEYGKFEVAMDIQGRLDAVYNPREKVLALWFLPQGEPELNFSQVGDIEVNEEGLWASVLGGVASVFMQSPETMAAETFEALGRKKLVRKLEKGFSIAADFCSGRVVVRMAKMSRQELVSSLEEKVGESQAHHAQMHPDGLIVAGPFSAGSEKLQIKISGTSGNQLHAQLVCQEEANRMASAFLNDKRMPEVQTLTDNRAGSLLTMEASSDNCPVVLVTRPAGPAKTPFDFNYRVNEHRAMKPLADCD